MKIPDGMNSDDIINQINIVINRIAPKYAFSGYEIDDMKQEAFIICMDALDRYDCKRPLENFLSVHLSNRLKNFVRDNHFSKDDEDKKKVMAPKQLSYDDNVVDKDLDQDLNIDTKEIRKIIDKFLPFDFRSDYLKLSSDVYIPKKRKTTLINKIKEILKENGYEKR